MKKKLPFVCLALLAACAVTAQTTLVNYDFSAASSYPASPASTAAGISCSATSSEPFQTYTGVATSSVAFTQNTTAGNALAMVNSSGTNTRYFTFQLSGSNLANYQSYKLYLQPQRSTTGATLITVAYSTNGSSYTNVSTTFPVSTAFSDVTVDLSSATALNNAPSVYIRLLVSAATASTGTIRIDNFEVQATQGTGGSGGNPWTVSGNNVSFPGMVGIGTASPAFPLDVTGASRITGNIQVGGTTTLTGDITASNKLNVAGDITASNKLNVAGDATVQGSLFATTINLGTAASSNLISSVNTGNAGLIYFGPVSNQSSAIVCIPPYTGSGNIFPARITIPPTGSQNINNQLDFRNDGLSSFIEYGHNSAGSPPGDQQRQGSPTVNTTWPTLKINSLCNGNVELGFGGGTVSTGKYFEVGYPNRNFNIASNIFTDGIKTGQRITTVHPASAVPGVTLYNTQLFVNSLQTHALGVMNNAVNTAGDEVFTVYADGKTQVNAAVQANKYFTVNDVSTPNTPKESFVVYGNGKTSIGVGRPLANGIAANAMLSVDGLILAKEVRVAISTTTHWADYVFEKNYRLMPLNDLEKYIKANKHLPDVPSSKEVEDDGIDITEISATLLKKIEELTLYTIELQKKVEAQQVEINALKK